MSFLNIYLASVKDKRGTIRTKDMEPAIGIKPRTGYLYKVHFRLGQETGSAIFHLSRENKSLYADEWPGNIPLPGLRPNEIRVEIIKVEEIFDHQLQLFRNERYDK